MGLSAAGIGQEAEPGTRQQAKPAPAVYSLISHHPIVAIVTIVNCHADRIFDSEVEGKGSLSAKKVVRVVMKRRKDGFG
jgi:hypothetical protein